MVDYIAVNYTILTSIAVELLRKAPPAGFEWDDDPHNSLEEYDRGQRFNRLVAKLPQLKRLEIWKGRTCSARHMRRSETFPQGELEKGAVYAAELDETKLKEIAENHFRDKALKSARYERRAWGEYLEQQSDNDLFMKEGFVLHFT